MEREMMAWFPGKVQALLIDDDGRFRTSSVKMLSLLNFKVSIYKNPGYALNRILTGDKGKEIDVVFINAKKALSCGIDFRAIVQAQLSIPVVYLLPRHGDQVDKMRRSLRRPGTYTLGMPLEVEDVLRLWRFIAWSKFCLQNEKARNDGVQSTVGEAPTMAGGSTVNKGREDQERIHFEQQQLLRQSVKQSILHALGMLPNNPGMSPDAAGPSNYLATAGNTAGPSSLPVYPPPRPVFSAPVPAPPPPPVNPSLVPTQAPRPVFSALAPAPPLPPPVNPSLLPAQAPRPMYPYQGPRPPMPQGRLFAPPRLGVGMPRRGNGGPIMLNFDQPQSSNRFTAMASSGGMVFGASAAAGHAGAYNYAASSLHHSLNPAGTNGHNKLSAMVNMMHTVFNNPPVAPLPQQHVGVGSNVSTLYNNDNYFNAGPLVAPQQKAGHGVAANKAAAAMEALGSDANLNNYNSASHVAPQDDVPPYDLAAFEAELNSDNFSNYSDGGSLMPSPDQVLGMASSLNDLITMAGGSFGSHVAASSSMAPPHQDLVIPAPNGNNQIPSGALGDDIDASLMGPQGPSAAMDGNNAAGLKEMFPAEQNEENLYAQLQDLIKDFDDAPTYEYGVGHENHMSGATSGAATVTASDAAATSLMGGESSMGIWDIDAENFEMVVDFAPNGTEDFMLRMT